MQRRIDNEVRLAKTVSPFESTGRSSSIDRTAVNFTNATEKIQKIKRLIDTREDDADLAKYISGMLNLIFQGMIENINTKEQVAHISYKDMENLEFQIVLANSYYTNPNSMHICFPMKIKKASEKNSDIDMNLITVNIFLLFNQKKFT